MNDDQQALTFVFGMYFMILFFVFIFCLKYKCCPRCCDCCECCDCGDVNSARNDVESMEPSSEIQSMSSQDVSSEIFSDESSTDLPPDYDYISDPPPKYEHLISTIV